jgi:hypothetical protein
MNLRVHFPLSTGLEHEQSERSLSGTSKSAGAGKAPGELGLAMPDSDIVAGNPNYPARRK